MCPSKTSFGIIQAIMSLFYEILKEAFPQFIHSYKKRDLIRKITKEIRRSDWKSLSIDGSAWDSSQFGDLQWVDTYFLNNIKD